MIPLAVQMLVSAIIFLFGFGVCCSAAYHWRQSPWWAAALWAGAALMFLLAARALFSV